MMTTLRAWSQTLLAYAHFQSLRPGIQVFGNYQQLGYYYPGRLHAVNGEKCTIHYLDGDKETDVSTTQVLFLPKQTTKTALSAGTYVLVPPGNEPAQCLYNRHGKRTSTWCCYCLQDQSTRRQIDLEISKTKTHGRWVRVSLITMLLLVTITMNSNSRFYDTHLRQYRPKFFPRTTSFTTTKKDGTKITPRTPRCILWQHLCHVLRDECMSIDELQTIWRRNQWTCQRLRSVDSISRRMVYTTC